MTENTEYKIEAIRQFLSCGDGLGASNNRSDKKVIKRHRVWWK